MPPWEPTTLMKREIDHYLCTLPGGSCNNTAGTMGKDACQTDAHTPYHCSVTLLLRRKLLMAPCCFYVI